MEERELNELKKQYLKSYKYAVKREQTILEEIQRLRMDKMFPSIVFDDMPHGTECKDLSDYAAAVDEEIEKLKNERLEKVRIYSGINRRINEMKDDKEKEVLTLKYIKMKKWEDICVEMGYSWQHIHRIHASALKNFKYEIE